MPSMRDLLVPECLRFRKTFYSIGFVLKKRWKCDKNQKKCEAAKGDQKSVDIRKTHCWRV